MIVALAVVMVVGLASRELASRSVSARLADLRERLATEPHSGEVGRALEAAFDLDAMTDAARNGACVAEASPSAVRRAIEVDLLELYRRRTAWRAVGEEEEPSGHVLTSFLSPSDTPHTLRYATRGGRVVDVEIAGASRVEAYRAELCEAASIGGTAEIEWMLALRVEPEAAAEAVARSHARITAGDDPGAFPLDALDAASLARIALVPLRERESEADLSVLAECLEALATARYLAAVRALPEGIGYAARDLGWLAPTMVVTARGARPLEMVLSLDVWRWRVFDFDDGTGDLAERLRARVQELYETGGLPAVRADFLPADGSRCSAETPHAGTAE